MSGKQNEGEALEADDLIREIESEKKRVPLGSDEDRASRLYIMRYVVIIYCIVLAGTITSIFIEAWMSGKWEGMGQSMLQVSSVLVLPILTLVLGYYFGREGRK